MAPMRALMTPAKRMERSISPDRPCVWARCGLPTGLGAPADSRDPASSTNAFTCAGVSHIKPLLRMHLDTVKVLSCSRGITQSV